MFNEYCGTRREDCPALLGRAERATVRQGQDAALGNQGIARTRFDEGRVVRLRGRRGWRRDRSGQAPRKTRDQRLSRRCTRTRIRHSEAGAKSARAEAVHPAHSLLLRRRRSRGVSGAADVSEELPPAPARRQGRLPAQHQGHHAAAVQLAGDHFENRASRSSSSRASSAPTC